MLTLRLTLFFALSILCYYNGLAQIGENRHIWLIGINTGVNVNKVLFTPTIRQSHYWGPTIGFTTRYTSERYFKMLCSLQIELSYTQAGWKEDIRNSVGETLPDHYQRNISYLQLPILANLAFGKEAQGLKTYLLLGPQLGIALSSTEKRSDIWTMTNNSTGTLLPDRPNGVIAQYGKELDKSFDYGIVLGLGTELNSKIGYFSLDIRYYYGLADIFNNAKRDPFSRSSNNALMAKLSYLISPITPKKK